MKKSKKGNLEKAKKGNIEKKKKVKSEKILSEPIEIIEPVDDSVQVPDKIYESQLQNSKMVQIAQEIIKAYDDPQQELNDIRELEESLMKSCATHCINEDYLDKNYDIKQAMLLKLFSPFKEHCNSLRTNVTLLKAQDLDPNVFYQLIDQNWKESRDLKEVFNQSSDIILPSINQIKTLHASTKKRSKPFIRQMIPFKQTEQAIPRDKISKSPVVPIFIVEPEEIVFYDYSLVKIHQKQLKLRNCSNFPVGLDKLKVKPSEMFSVKMSHGDWEKCLIAPGMSITMMVEYTPNLSGEVEGSIIIKTSLRGSIVVKIVAFRKHPCLSTSINVKWPQLLEFPSLVECGECLVGNVIQLTKKIHNLGGDGMFIILGDHFYWEDIKIQELCPEDNILTKMPFSISPACFSIEGNSDVDIICEFSPSEPGTHAECVIVACDIGSWIELTIIGEGLNYESYFVAIQDLKKNFNITIEDDIHSNYYIDMGDILPFTSKTKQINVIKDCDITFKYKWELREAIINVSYQPDYLDSSNCSWSVIPNTGILDSKTNIFSVYLSLKNSAFGKYRHVMSLILEGIPEKCLANKEVLLMKTNRGSFETQINGSVNLLVAEVELWAECIPLQLEIHPRLIFLPIPIAFGTPFTTEATIFNRNHVSVYCSWKINQAITGEEKLLQNCIAWDAKITPFEVCLPPHEVQRFIVMLLIKQSDEFSPDTVISLIFNCMTWYEACNSDIEIKFQSQHGVKNYKVAEGPPLKFFLCGRTGVSKVKISGNVLTNETPFDFDIIRNDVKIKKKVFIENLTNQFIKCSLRLLKNQENVLTWRNPSDSDKTFSICPDVMGIGRNLTEEAILKFHPMIKKKYCELLVAGIDGMQPGPTWDFALTSGTSSVPSLVLYPSTSFEVPYQIPKAWAGTTLKLPNKDFALKNLSYHSSLLSSFRWGLPIEVCNSQIQIAIHPNFGIIKPQETIYFSIIISFNSKAIEDFTLPCFMGKQNDPLLLFFKCSVESPMISFYSTTEEINEFTVNDIITMGLINKEIVNQNNSCTLNSIWSFDCSPTTILCFQDIPSYTVGVKKVWIENKSPFSVKYKVKFKNYGGEIRNKKHQANKCFEEHENKNKEDHFDPVSLLSPQTTVIEAIPNVDVLSPWGKSEVEIWLISSTWGIYFEEITLEFHDVVWENKKQVASPPPLFIYLIANIISHPITFPAMINNQRQILRFGNVIGQNQKRERTVRVRNSSCLDIILVWNMHLWTKCQVDQPLQITVHYFNPSIFKYLKRNEINSTEIKNKNVILDKIDAFLFDKIKEISGEENMGIGILPRIGPTNDEIFKVNPPVSFIPPHSERILNLTCNCDVYVQNCSKFKGTLVGYVHISPEDSFSLGKFIRPQGTKLQLTLLSLKAFQVVPRIYVRHYKDDSTMKISIQKLLMEKFVTSRIFFKKKLFLQNKSHGLINLQFYVGGPFTLSVDYDMDTKVESHSPNSAECFIPSERAVEINIKCIFTNNILDWVLDVLRGIHRESDTSLTESWKSDAITDNENHVTINQTLTVRQDEFTMKVVPLQLIFLFPSASVSTTRIDFGSVEVNSSKIHEVLVKNNTDEILSFSTSVASNIFSARPESSQIPGDQVNARNSTTIASQVFNVRPEDIQIPEDEVNTQNSTSVALHDFNVRPESIHIPKDEMNARDSTSVALQDFNIRPGSTQIPEDEMNARDSTSVASYVFNVRPESNQIPEDHINADSFAPVYVTFTPRKNISYQGTVMITLIKEVKEIPIQVCGKGI